MEIVRFNTDEDIASVVGSVERPIPFVVEPGEERFCGQVLNGTYGYRMGIRTPRLREILQDFEAYESSAHWYARLVGAKACLAVCLIKEPWREHDGIS